MMMLNLFWTLLNMTFLNIMKAATVITDAFKLTLRNIKVEYKLYINEKKEVH